MNTVELIKEKLGIVEVVSTYVKLDRAGANLKGKCPFHNEKTPSFFVSPSRNSYYCFGCNAKGDIFSFIQDFERVDFKGALKILAEKAGVEIQNTNPAEEKEKDNLYKILESASSFYQDKLKNNTEVGKYLHDRGLLVETIIGWNLGFSPSGWNELRDYLKSKGFKETDIEKTGLIKAGDHGFYDRFRGRIMFPILDSSGRTVGFSGRIYGDGKDGKEAKYINSPETQLFNKSEILYGLNKAKEHIRSKGFILLVEGQLDLLMCHQRGLSQTVATSGTALTESQLLIIKRFTNNLMISYDGDKAGVSASKRAFELALSLGLDVKIAALPSGLDPAEMLKKEPEEFRNLLRKSEHIIDFSLNSIITSSKQKGMNERALLREVKENVLPYVESSTSPVERAYFISKIAERIKIPETALYEELRLKGGVNSTFNAKKEKIEFAGQVPEKKIRKEVIERKIAGLAFKEGEEKRVVMEKTFSRLFEDIDGQSFSTLISPYENQKEMLIYEAELDEGEEGEGGRFEELLIELKREILRAKLENATLDLKLAEKEGQAERGAELLKLCQELFTKLSNVKI